MGMRAHKQPVLHRGRSLQRRGRSRPEDAAMALRWARNHITDYRLKGPEAGIANFAAWGFKLPVVAVLWMGEKILRWLDRRARRRELEELIKSIPAGEGYQRGRGLYRRG